MEAVRSPKHNEIDVNIAGSRNVLSKEWYYKLSVKTGCREVEIVEPFIIFTK
ncbi:hypothetical protein JYU34_010910 [Plutella xylostella]|uniref:Uncharacterized protein n=1 Tax=Plutella xylostella TaxID=51655 RepID=A0ABQ7QFK8_PLUXY|nr:hypothetical protein JYU34_010910 [Plutella xylostella]